MTIGRLLVFEGTAFDWVVGGLALALFGVLVVLARQRPDKRRLGLRIGLSATAVIALTLIGWQPQRLGASQGSAAILITPGASSGLAARLADSLGAPLYALPEARHIRPPGRTVDVVPDAGFIVRRHPEATTLHIIGEGVPGYALAGGRPVAVQAYTAPPQPGVQFVDVPPLASVGEATQVQGQVFFEPSEWPVVVYLDDPGGRVDSVEVTGPGTSPFSLETTPRQAGHHPYRLAIVKALGDTLALETFEMRVQDPVPLRVLVLQGAPRFETRHLKNWLAAEGGHMAIRSTISRDRYRAEFVNQPERDLSRLTSGVLRAFDVVMLDERAAKGLSVPERRVLERAMVEEGLGLLLAADLIAAEQGASLPRFVRGFDGQPLGASEGRRVRLTWDDVTLQSPIPAEAYAIQRAWGVDPLMYDEAGNTIAAIRQHGVGRIGLSLATETYRWVLEGNSGMHAAYWSQLLSTLARAPVEADQWSAGGGKPIFRAEPVLIELRTRAASPIGLVYSTGASPDTIYLAQDLVEPTRWRSTFWPREVGWHRVQAAKPGASAVLVLRPSGGYVAGFAGCREHQSDETVCGCIGGAAD